jgi:hypothetical protein
MQTQNRIMIIQRFLFRNCRRGIIMYKFYLKFLYTCIYLYYGECVFIVNRVSRKSIKVEYWSHFIVRVEKCIYFFIGQYVTLR